MQVQFQGRVLSRLLATGWATAFVLATASGGVAGSPLEEARGHHRAGRLDQAVTAYRDALAVDSLDNASRAVAANNLCVILDSRGELESAEEACRQALEIRRALGDRLRLARTLNNLGLVLQHRGRYREAVAGFSEALAINRELEESLAESINLANLGAVATLAGRFQEALDRHAEVSELARVHAGEPWAAEQQRIAEINRAVVLERLGSYRQALEIYGRLLDETQGLSPEEEASILVNSGVIYRNLGDPVQAIERFDEAATAYSEMGDRSGLAHARLNVGIARHLNLEDLSGARAAYESALKLVEDAGDQALEIEILGFLGRLLLASEGAEAASETFEQALALARDSGSAEGEWVALAGLGASERVRGRLQAALGRFESAIALIEEGRSEVVRSDYRASFFADKRSVYSEALDVLAALAGRTGLEDRERSELAARALHVAQRAKSRDLLDALDLRRAGVEWPATPMVPLDTAEIQRRLRGDRLLEYYVTDTDVLLWRVGSDSIRLVRLGDPDPILEAVESVHRALANGEEPSGELVDRASALLLGPLEEMSDAFDDRALWIAPDRLLFYLPFEIVNVAAESGREPVRLIERARIAYLPSAWALPDAAERQRPGEFDVTFVGFGGVSVNRGPVSPAWVSELGIGPLPAARDELEAVAKRLGGSGRTFFEARATEASFREIAKQRVGVMHFATHSALVNPPRGATAILLTPDGEDDGLLSPAEVAGSTVSASLVVLAACTTAPSGEEDGSAVSNLTGAFLAAGSRAVLATLWPVSDQPTAVFMEQFYYRLGRGLAPAEALRETKLQFMSEESWQNPALWSGYVLVGSSPPIAGHRPAWMLIGALVLAAAVGLAIWRTRAP